MSADSQELLLSEGLNAEPWGDLESHQLLQKKLASVGNAHFADMLGALTDGALELLLSKIGLTNQSTNFANVHFVAITDIKEPFFEEASSTM